ncbi:hypothetical protein BZA05DRAFT_340376 [Tricharina praecox]|uniref:uncharacterized protein n=1 Tax=Tricharina praecox TaxID=43433 RepID=UPI002220F313|nr:uncharacterized protein BZA05DRAFT_340376 [Tricharina praecox]KAI5848047.1 hypothetical protein BZA05DRAFT_340376 [Tricharina praecox]
MLDLHAASGGITDEETLQAIIAVQLADLDEALALSNRKGKGVVGAESPRVSAAENPLQAYRDYLSKEAICLADAKLARSMDQALKEDAFIIGEALQFLQDRQLAMDLSGHVDEPVRGFSVPRMMHTPGADSRLPMGYATGSGTSSGVSSSTSLPCEAVCCSCLEDHFCVTAPCGDTYCHNCLKKVFHNATWDEELFPPRCHKQEIPLYLAQPFLQKEEIAEFKAKREEFTSHNRVYCHNSQCGVFILTKNIVDDCATCNACAMRTCVSCKQRYHGKTDCPTDTNLNKTLELAAANGWQRCYTCHALVERLFGCQHISCKCGAEFCYRCGLKWKTCQCGDWDERALERRAEQLAIREVLADRPAVPARIAHRTREIRQRLQERHVCEHDGEWQVLNGQHNCEMCGDRLRAYIWSCEGCSVLACTRCRMHRV